MQPTQLQGSDGRPAAVVQPSAVPPRLGGILPAGYGLDAPQMQILRSQILAFKTIKATARKYDDDKRNGVLAKIPTQDDLCPPQLRQAARAGTWSRQPAPPVASQAMLQVSVPPPPHLLRPQDWAPGVLAAISRAWARTAGQQPPLHNQISLAGGIAAAPTPQPPQGVGALSRASPAVQAPTRMVAPTGGPAAAAVSTAPQAPPLLPQDFASMTPHRGPLYTLGAGGPPMPLMCDVGALLGAELQARIRARGAQALAQVESKLLSARSAGRPAPVAVRLQRARWLARQAQLTLRGRIQTVQGDINSMADRQYRRFARDCARERFDMTKAEDKAKSDAVAERARNLKACRGAMGDRTNTSRELRVVRNRGVLRAHERLSRLHSKARGDERAQRMAALKAHDFEAYQELLQRETGGTGATPGERYEAISKFLSETEDYLHRLTARVASVKLAQEASEAAAAAIAAARLQGCTDEEVQAAARAAAADAAQASDLMRRGSNSAAGGDAQERYYSVAHAVEERVTEQPSLLRPPNGAKLREYQMVGLQWMVSLFNNRLNGILADEMGLGKTVQVMALLAHLMQHKGVSGPHLIIVPNAVMVNWKAELQQWLPDMKKVWYVGGREERSQKYQKEVVSIQFNVLVTTYEFVMRDRAKLSKVDWHYIIIDEAQRMKDRQSKLAKDLDRFVAQRRLLLTGTPLQNDLSELWSLLNLLLPEVFDDKDMFGQWFGSSPQGGGAQGAGQGEDWLETEKRVVVIHRLHQILEPFMLRRQVEDVESKLPPKIAHTIKVAMPPFQATIYNWVVRTGTLRSDPEAPVQGSVRRPYITLNNKCMELRKVCNHPSLSYPYAHQFSDGKFLVSQCGKLLVLDRMLVKLHAAGHRVLLFATMTKLLDLLEYYLAWRRVPDGKGGTQPLGHLRIDGSTALEARETAIQTFNAPNSNAFLFLLSIRAAGRGLNLQSSDTVIIYDPDANPKNEEQAIARSHRIGQTREVRVYHFEAVADAPDQPLQGAKQAAGEDTRAQRYADSIESLVRNNIQKAKIDMANEVIDAGRFDMQTTMGERKLALESLLQDEERTKVGLNEVPSLQEMNKMLARTPEELELFEKLDHEIEWPSPAEDVPAWLRYTASEATEALMASAKLKPNEVAQLKAAEAARIAAEGGAPAAALPQTPSVAGPSKTRRKSRPTVSFQMSTASTLGTTDSEADDAGNADADDMEEEFVGANVREESQALVANMEGSLQHGARGHAGEGLRSAPSAHSLGQSQLSGRESSLGPSSSMPDSQGPAKKPKLIVKWKSRKG
ncbi:hypothetical protein WJX73_005391 [Symbiochloris irregularis]|uniref:Uncharacterized protein n=1 Tax=Symbiochloris irregularis TaxID=706552 RepID=A0AAW1NLF8_9CHLO